MVALLYQNKILLSPQFFWVLGCNLGFHSPWATTLLLSNRPSPTPQICFLLVFLKKNLIYLLHYLLVTFPFLTSFPSTVMSLFNGDPMSLTRVAYRSMGKLLVTIHWRKCPSLPELPLTVYESSRPFWITSFKILTLGLLVTNFCWHSYSQMKVFSVYEKYTHI